MWKTFVGDFFFFKYLWMNLCNSANVGIYVLHFRYSWFFENMVIKGSLPSLFDTIKNKFGNSLLES